MNKYTGIGRLTQDPDVRYTQDGKAVASFRLAVNRRVKREGEPDADFFNFTAFGNVAEIIEKYVVKGTQVAVEAEPRNDNYTDKNGNEVHTIKFYVDRIDLLGRPAGAQQNAAPGPQFASPNTPQTQQYQAQPPQTQPYQPQQPVYAQPSAPAPMPAQTQYMPPQQPVQQYSPEQAQAAINAINGAPAQAGVPINEGFISADEGEYHGLPFC